LSFDAGQVIPVNQVATFADGAAVTVPDETAFAPIKVGAARIVDVAEDDIAQAVRIYHEDTHNLAEGTGALALAALAKEQAQFKGRKAGVILSGGNIDRGWAADILAGKTPRQS
jgi:threonine dehydratase